MRFGLSNLYKPRALAQISERVCELPGTKNGEHTRPQPDDLVTTGESLTMNADRQSAGLSNGCTGPSPKPTYEELLARVAQLEQQQLASLLERAQEKEAAVRQREERHRLALAAGAMATWDWHVPSGEVVWNDEHLCRKRRACRNRQLRTRSRPRSRGPRPAIRGPARGEPVAYVPCTSPAERFAAFPRGSVGSDSHEIHEGERFCMGAGLDWRTC